MHPQEIEPTKNKTTFPLNDLLSKTKTFLTSRSFLFLSILSSKNKIHFNQGAKI